MLESEAKEKEESESVLVIPKRRKNHFQHRACVPRLLQTQLRRKFSLIK